jgi:hypothetical protein
MEIVPRDKIPNDYADMMKTEDHHNHEIVMVNGTIRWKPNHPVNFLLEKLNLNDLCPLLIELGHDKNSELYRKLYRDMGYSLSGYWEIFYWDWNNEKTCLYRQPVNKEQKVLEAISIIEDYFFDQFDNATTMVPDTDPARVVCAALEKARELIRG